MKNSTTKRAAQHVVALPSVDAMAAIDKLLMAQREICAAINFVDTTTEYGEKSNICISPKSMGPIRAAQQALSKLLTHAEWVQS